MASRKRMHGRRRHPSRCQTPFPKINPNGNGGSDPNLIVAPGGDEENASSWDTWLDRAQVGLSVGGLVNPFADIANIGVSVLRGGYDALTGDYEGAWEHAKGAAWNTLAAVPVIGDVAGGVKLAKTGAQMVR